jgi:preprotein translocase subunit SecG
MTTFLAVIFVAVAVLIVLVVLVQRGRGGGLAGAFGSGGGSSSAFGTKTGDVFTTATVVLFAVFMLLAIWLNFRFQSYKETAVFGQKVSDSVPMDSGSPTTKSAADGMMVPAPSAPAMPIAPMAPTGMSAPSSQPK